MLRRAIRWLADEELISPDVAERVRAEHPEPVVSAGLVDVDRLVRDVADDLRVLYGDRLVAGCRVVAHRLRRRDRVSAPPWAPAGSPSRSGRFFDDYATAFG